MNKSIFDCYKEIDLQDYLDVVVNILKIKDQRAELETLARFAIKYYSGNKSLRGQMSVIHDLENKWYKSLEENKSAYHLYNDVHFLSDIFACWVVYSRKYLRLIKNTDVIDCLFPVKSAVDLGCGFGYTTAALKAMFPEATVYGTNFKDSCQYKIASFFAKRYNFIMKPDLESIGEQTDLVFASEYFEHIENPIEHLNNIIDVLNPKFFIVANAFNTQAFGHFISHKHLRGSIHGSKMGRIFNATLRGRGFIKCPTGFWNNRPAVWIKAKKGFHLL